MGSSGLEPPTSRLSGVRSNLLSYEPIHLRGASVPFALPLSGGGDERDRTDGLLLAKQALSQLSYTPISLRVRTLKIKQRLLFLIPVI